jgi:hypothetical protein
MMLLAAMLAAATVHPAVLTGLPAGCRDWAGDRVVALACDPQHEARSIRLELGATRGRATHTLGIGQVAGAEPLQPGETVTVRWSHPSARAVVAVSAAAPDGPRLVVVGLRGRPERVDVAAQAGGALEVTTSAGNLTVPARPAPAPVDWRPRSARAAATRILSAVDRLERAGGARRLLCAALDRDVFPFYEQLFGDPAKYPCASGLTFYVFGDENVPRPTATIHRGSSLAVRRGRALLSTTLTHRYQPSSTTDPRRLVVHARVLLVRDAQGIWRLATIEPLLPLVATYHRRPFTDAELDRLHRSDVREGRKAAAAAARLLARRDAATVDGSGPAPCSAATSGDPAGDVTVEESEFRARDQHANAGLDVVAVGAAGRCLALRTAGPLPAGFEVDLHGAGTDPALHVTVVQGRVLVEDVSDEDHPPTPLTGAVAHLDPDGLVLLLPKALTSPVSIALRIERDRITYGDDATTPRATNRRCARPTC